ncbi:TetR/AcrR family transcriptional regulator [Cellulomonas sp. URHD0024]|uniref:TetR/AcrR family transcriptional regulator n=1 Tax=Cellulomonas sp. URHD0024 TaxID=1302620 RepID=UPI00042951EA|nr:TetR/AcrR family transcriptional regulator [Cellulomonas sp. URHD0024]
MTRPREFEQQAVLDAAVDVFWEQGYESTSIADLEVATGLSRSSLYQAFGSKHALYESCLDRYKTRNIDPALAAMSAPGAGRAELVTYLTTLATVFRSDPSLAMRGCMIVNGVAERGAHDPEVRRAGLAYRQAIVDALANALRGAARTESQRADASNRAALMSVTLIGALVTAHMDAEGAARICQKLAADLP